MRISRALLLLGLTFFCLLPARVAIAAGSAEPTGKDVLVFINGDQLTGTFVRSAGSKIIFRSSMAGELTLDWSRVKNLRSPRDFVVLKKDQRLSRKSASQVPAGDLTVKDGVVSLANGAANQTIAVDRAADVIDQRSFEKQALERDSPFRHWTGAANLGALAVLATQDTYNVNAGVTLARESPGVDYLPARNRTLINYSSSYSRITQRQFPEAPLLPNLNISIYHADAEHDQYIARRVYVLAQTVFDHNYSQGLDLQQIYGAGAGITVLKRRSQTLDVRATLQREKQNFLNDLASENRTLIGSTFSATYILRLPYNVVFRQEVQYIPAYNLRYAYSFSERNSVVYPLYKRLSLQLGTADSYLNNPPPIIYPAPVNRPNSLQFTTGVSFSLK